MADRQQWIFSEKCGCPFGVMEFAGESRPEAWREFYDGDSGVFLRLVEHGRYATEFMPMMRSEYRCPHGGGS